MELFRIGFGNDIHRFAPDRKLYLCGCGIPCPSGGLLGHSDADAPIHAVIDALLGALALGDIGQHFPDTDPRYKDAVSTDLLHAVLALEPFKDWTLSNLDMTIVAQKPKLAPYIPDMRQSLARHLGCDVSRISVKAKTAEGLDSVGRCEAIEVQTVLLLERKTV